MKTIVVYYSAQNHTRVIAEKLAELIGADKFEIQPAEAYSEADLDYMDTGSRVSREHEDAKLQNVALASSEVPNWADYERVVLLYPIWWGVSAWPVDSFVKAVDWNGKTVFPIAVSHSSPMGESGALLAEKANGGEWQEGARLYQDAGEHNIQTVVDKL